MLLDGTALAVCHIMLLPKDALRSACHCQAKAQKNVVRDAPANVKQELMMVPILTLVPVDLEKAKEVLNGVPLVVKVVAEPPLKPQP